MERTATRGETAAHASSRSTPVYTTHAGGSDRSDQDAEEKFLCDMRAGLLRIVAAIERRMDDHRRTSGR